MTSEEYSFNKRNINNQQKILLDLLQAYSKFSINPNFIRHANPNILNMLNIAATPQNGVDDFEFNSEERRLVYNQRSQYLGLPRQDISSYLGDVTMNLHPVNNYFNIERGHKSRETKELEDFLFRTEDLNKGQGINSNRILLLPKWSFPSLVFQQEY